MKNQQPDPVKTTSDKGTRAKMSRARRMVTRPSGAPPTIQLTKRDEEIIRLCYRHRIVDSDMLRAYYGIKPKPKNPKTPDPDAGRRQYLKVRLHSLWLNKYLDRPANQLTLRLIDGYRALIYSVGAKGVKTLVEDGIPYSKLRWLENDDEMVRRNLKHSLGVSKFYFTLSALLTNNSNWQLTDWQQGTGIEEKVMLDKKELAVKPDAFFELTETLADGTVTPHYFFLEYDRNSVKEQTMGERYRRYFAYWKRINDEKRVAQGKLPMWSHPEQPRALPVRKAVRVLTVCTNLERAEKLKQWARLADDDQQGSRMFYFAFDGWSLTNPRALEGFIWTNPRDKEKTSLFK